MGSVDEPHLYMVFEGWDELGMLYVPVCSRRSLGLILGMAGSETQFHGCPWVCTGLVYVGGCQDFSVTQL